MQEFVDAIIKIRRKLEANELSVPETVVLLSQLIDKYEGQEDTYDSEKDYLKSLLGLKSFIKWDFKTKKTKSKLKNLRILMFLNDFGITTITENEIERIVSASI